MRKISPTAALFPEIRRRMLEVLFGNPARWWYLSELAEELGVTPSALQREIKRFRSAEIIEHEQRGNRVYFRANAHSIVFEDLSGLILKTSGLVDVIQTEIAKFKKEIDIAFIYGSIARSGASSYSDIDLLIVGAVSISKLSVPLKLLERKLGRRIEPFVMAKQEAMYNLKNENHFLQTVAKSPKIFLVRRDRELESAFEQQQAQATQHEPQ